MGISVSRIVVGSAVENAHFYSYNTSSDNLEVSLATDASPVVRHWQRCEEKARIFNFGVTLANCPLGCITMLSYT